VAKQQRRKPDPAGMRAALDARTNAPVRGLDVKWEQSALIESRWVLNLPYDVMLMLDFLPLDSMWKLRVVPGETVIPITIYTQLEDLEDVKLRALVTYKAIIGKQNEAINRLMFGTK
jgi:hypothetical protein